MLFQGPHVILKPRLTEILFQLQNGMKYTLSLRLYSKMFCRHLYPDKGTRMMLRLPLMGIELKPLHAQTAL